MKDVTVSIPIQKKVSETTSDEAGIEIVTHDEAKDTAVGNITQAEENHSPQLPQYAQEILPNDPHQSQYLKDIIKFSDRAADLVVNVNKANTLLSSIVLTLSHVLDVAREAAVLTDFEAENALTKNFPAVLAVLAMGHIAVRATHAMPNRPISDEALQENFSVSDQESPIVEMVETQAEKKEKTELPHDDSLSGSTEFQDSFAIELASDDHQQSGEFARSSLRSNSRSNSLVSSSVSLNVSSNDSSSDSLEADSSTEKKTPSSTPSALTHLTRGVAVLSRLISYYANPMKQASIDTSLSVGRFAAKTPLKSTKRLRHLTTLAAIATNLGSINTFRYFGTALDMIKSKQPLRGENLGHPLSPAVNNTNGTSVDFYRDIPHNAGASRAYVSNPFVQFLEAVIANQKDSLSVQLNRGARALMIDIKRGDNGTLESNHEFLDYGLLVEPLKELANFLNQTENTNERVLLLIENTNDVSVQEMAEVFTEAGLYPMLPKDLDAWKPQHLNDSRFKDARVFPVIGRSWNATGAEPGFARSLSVTGNDTDSYNDVVMRSGWYSSYPRVAVLQSNWNHTIPDKTDCPLSCEPITDLACIEVANHFGWPVPEIQSHLREHVEEHAKNCQTQNPNQNLYVSTDHTQLLN